MKPIAKSQGKGIFLFKRLKDITDWKKGVEYQPIGDQAKEGPETYVVQRYIENPYLIGGRKFDLRIYVLVTSKTAPDYDPEKGCKWSLQQLRQYFIAKHGIEAMDQMFKQINDIFIYSLQSCQRIIINDKHCFELYGYDILIDANLKPWLIEINASPSLTASNQEDYDLKFGLLNDVLNVLDMESRLTGKERRVGLFDLLWDDGPVYLDDSITSDYVNNFATSLNAFLGCNTDRKDNLRQVYQTAQALKKVA
nr:hypothetical protein BaRGS_021777 [Batillaria attramentaria]